MKKIILLFIIPLLLVAYQNCSGEFTSEQSLASNSFKSISGPPDSTEPPPKNPIKGKLLSEQPNVKAAVDSVVIGFKPLLPAKAHIEYYDASDGIDDDGRKLKSVVEDRLLLSHVQTVINLKPATTYRFRIVLENDANELFYTEFGEFLTLSDIVVEPELPPDKEPKTDWVHFDDIKKSGLKNACYKNSDFYLAEFLYQDPEACFWEMDEGSKKIRAQKIPTPRSPVFMPNPSGGNDSSALANLITKNPGRDIDGNNKTYKFANIKILRSVRLFNFKVEPSGNPDYIFKILSNDVHFYNVHIDAKNNNFLSFGWHAEENTKRFHLVKSSFKNLFHTKKKSTSAVYLTGSSDYHIACNTFENIVNDSGKGTTARANAIWKQGRKKHPNIGGYIVNNIGSNFYTNGGVPGGGQWDAEFYTTQSHSDGDQNEKADKIFANRCVDCGKRLAKFQSGGGHVLSNSYHWKTDQEPKTGNERTRLTVVASHFLRSDISVSNNRIKVSGTRVHSQIFNIMEIRQNRISKNINFDCNSIEINSKVNRDTDHYILFTRNNGYKNQSSNDDYSQEAKNSSFSNNYIFGTGSVRYYYRMGEGWSLTQGTFDTSGNVFELEKTKGVERK